MFSRLFPKHFDNSYQGSLIALWILAPIVLSKLFMGFNVAGFNPWISSRWVLQHADSIPIDTYSADAAGVVTFMFSAWGLALLTLSMLGLLALIRYRSMVPLLYLLLTFEQVGRRALSSLHPIQRLLTDDGLSPGAIINWGFSGLLLIGFALSLRERRID